MAKTNTKTDPYAKRREETDLQWRSRIARHDQAQRDKSEPLVPVEAMAHGQYVDDFVRADDNTIARAKINRGGTPVMRWAAANRLSDTQMLAISHCLQLWALAGLNPRTTASWEQRIGGSDHESERRVNAYVEANASLRKISGFARGDLWMAGYIPRDYWAIFEQVCRWDEPAGVAGSRLGYSERSGGAVAHTIVCMVADVIAREERLVTVSRIRGT